MEMSKMTGASVPIYRGEWLHPLNPQLLQSMRLPPAPWMPMAPSMPPPAPWLPTAAWLAPPPPCVPMPPWMQVAPCMPPAPWLPTAAWLSPPCVPTPSLPPYVFPVSSNWSPGCVPPNSWESSSSQSRPSQVISFPPPPYGVTYPPPPPYHSAPINPPQPSPPHYSLSSAQVNPATSAETNVPASFNTPPPEYSSPPSSVNSVGRHYLSSTLNPDAEPYQSAALNPADTVSSTSRNSPPPEYSSPASHSIHHSVERQYSCSSLNPNAVPYRSASLISPPPPEYFFSSSSSSSSDDSVGTEIICSTLNPAALPYPSPPLDSLLPTPPSDPWVPVYKEEHQSQSEPSIFRYARYSEDPLFSSVWRPLPCEQTAFEKTRSTGSSITVSINEEDSDPMSDYECGSAWSSES